MRPANLGYLKVIAAVTAIAGCGALVNGAQSGQQSRSRPAFEVVSVKHTGDLTARRMPRPVRFRGGRLNAEEVLSHLVMAAFHLEQWEYSGPMWMETEYYEVQAIAPADASDQTRERMLQTMLEDRFGLKYHREERQIPIYALTVASGGMRLGTEHGSAAGPNVMAAGVFKSNAATPKDLAGFLTFNMDRPVFDMTGLTTKYQMSFDWASALHRPTQEEAPKVQGGIIFAPPPVLDQSFVNSSLKKVGLQIEPRKSSVNVLIVDGAKRIPTPN